MKTYACGQCGGALEVADKAKTANCAYCGYSNDITNMEKEFQKFKSEVQSWLMDLGVDSHSGVDAGMRRLYFKDEIYPDLCTEFTNVVGDTDDILDYPLLYLPVYRNLPDLAIRRKWSVDDGKPMKELGRRLESPQLKAFAPDALSQKLLLELKLKALMIPMLMDVIALSSSPDDINLQRSSSILKALADEVRAIVKVTSKDKTLEDQKVYYEMLESRLRINSEAYSRLSKSVSSRNLLDKEWLNSQMKVLYEQRAALKGLANVSVIDKIPLDYGLSNDGASLVTWNNILKSYLTLTEKPFTEFVSLLEQFAVQTFFFEKQAHVGVDIAWFTDSTDSQKFAWFIDALCSTCTTDSVKMISAENKTKGRFLYPFYYLNVETILRSGSLWWKKGKAEDFHVLIDAGFNLYDGFYRGDYPSLMTPVGKKIVGQDLERILDSLETTEATPVPSEMTLLPPIVSPQDATNIFIQAHNFRDEAEYARAEDISVDVPKSYKKKGFDPGRVKAVMPKYVGLFHVPMAIKDGSTILYGDEYGLDRTLSHRMNLAKGFTGFKQGLS